MRGVHIADGHVERVLARLPAPAGPFDSEHRLRRGRIVWEWGSAVLRHYPAPDAPARARPVLIVYAHVNRPAVLDLHPKHSLIAALQAAGRAVYLLDWGRPGPHEARRELAHYVLDGIGGALGAMPGPAHLLGVCQGGSLALMYAALRPAQVRSLTAFMTPVDFSAPMPLRPALDVYLKRAPAPTGYNLPGAVLASAFALLDPLRRPPAGGPGTRSSRRLAALLDAWLADTPDLPGRATDEFLRACYGDNALVRGTLRLRHQTVDLRRLRIPVFNLYAAHDHLVPPASSAALRHCLPAAGYRALYYPGGHLSLLVSPHALRQVAPRLAGWLAAHD